MHSLKYHILQAVDCIRAHRRIKLPNPIAISDSATLPHIQASIWSNRILLRRRCIVFLFYLAMSVSVANRALHSSLLGEDSPGFFSLSFMEFELEGPALIFLTETRHSPQFRATAFYSLKIRHSLVDGNILNAGGSTLLTTCVLEGHSATKC